MLAALATLLPETHQVRLLTAVLSFKLRVWFEAACSLQGPGFASGVSSLSSKGKHTTRTQWYTRKRLEKGNPPVTLLEAEDIPPPAFPSPLTPLKIVFGPTVFFHMINLLGVYSFMYATITGDWGTIRG